MISHCLVQRRSQEQVYVFNNWEMNWATLSEMISAGTPKRKTHWPRKALATIMELMSGMGIASGHHENLSTIVNRYERPWYGGRGPTKSMLTDSNRESGTCTFSSGARTCRWILALWQARHSLAHLATSLLRPCHTNLSPTSHAVALAPECDRLWRAWKIVRSNAAGTHSLGRPWETSQRRVWLPISTSWRQRFVIAVLTASASGSCCWARASLQKSMPRVESTVDLYPGESICYHIGLALKMLHRCGEF